MTKLTIKDGYLQPERRQRRCYRCKRELDKGPEYLGTQTVKTQFREICLRCFYVMNYCPLCGKHLKKESSKEYVMRKDALICLTCHTKITKYEWGEPVYDHLHIEEIAYYAEKKPKKPSYEEKIDRKPKKEIDKEKATERIERRKKVGRRPKKEIELERRKKHVGGRPRKKIDGRKVVELKQKGLSNRSIAKIVDSTHPTIKKILEEQQNKEK